MSKITNNINNLIFSEKDANTNFYTHSVFCQCILPVRSLPQEQDIYETSHGNTSLSIQSGYIRNHETKKSVKQEIPSGAKARLLFSYINDQAIRLKRPDIDMGSNLYRFMQDNNIPVGGKNAKELQRQAMNIAAASIHLGVWSDTATKSFSRQRNVQIAKDISFWLEKDPTQVTLWQPTMTLSDDYMAALEHHRVPINFQALVALQANPRAMDMYVWLKYRIHHVRAPVRIPYEALHTVFGQSISTLKEFKVHIKRAIENAKQYCPEAMIEFDKNCITLINTTRSFISLGNNSKTLLVNEKTEIGGKVSNQLTELGFSDKKISKLFTSYEISKIEKAINITQENLKTGSIKKPQAYFTKALEEDWQTTTATQIKNEAVLDTVYEDCITDKDWKKVRAEVVNKFGITIFNNWIKNLQINEKGRGEVILVAKTRFIAEEIKKKYLVDLQKFWLSADKKIKDVIITVEKNK